MHEVLIEALRADRYKDFPRVRILTIAHLGVTTLLFALSIIFSFIVWFYPEYSHFKSLLKLFLIIAAVNPIILYLKQFFLAKFKVRESYAKRKIIRHILTLLVRHYQWKGACRVTVFVPASDDKVVVYDRISGGRPAGYSRRDSCFFRMGQGVPGLAMQKAWDGKETKELVHCFQFEDVPGEILDRKTSQLRDYFRNHFRVQDEDIYTSLSDEKLRLRSYMAVGILSPEDASLAAMLVGDSESENIFSGFKQMQAIAEKPIRDRSEELSLSVGSESGIPAEMLQLMNFPDFPAEIQKDLEKLNKGGDDATTKKFIKAIGVKIMSKQLGTDFKSSISSAILPFEWALESIKEILKVH